MNLEERVVVLEKKLDALDEMEKKQNTINSSILDVLDMLKQKAHSHQEKQMGSVVVAQDERSCDECLQYGQLCVGTENKAPCRQFVEKQPKQAQEQDERGCDDCFHEEDCMDNGKRCRSGDKKLGAWQPKAQEQLWICLKLDECGCNSCSHLKPHKKTSLCDGIGQCNEKCIPYEEGLYTEYMKQKDLAEFHHKDAVQCAKQRDGLRARLALLEKENAELRDWNKFAKESVAVASAEVSKLQAKNAELKRQLSENHDWICGCGHWNAPSLANCGMCKREPGAKQ